MRIAIINGPNLNLLGKREPHIYGYQTFEDFLETLKTQNPTISFDYFQSNHEGALIDKIHSIGYGDIAYDGIILNAGGYTHTSVALADAVSAVPVPTVEVHISNIHERESFRHHSYIAPRCAGSIVGLGIEGYALAVSYFDKKFGKK